MTDKQKSAIKSFS